MTQYTDGLAEYKNADGEDYGAERINRLLQSNRELPAQELVELILEDYRSFRVKDADDVTLLVFKKR